MNASNPIEYHPLAVRSYQQRPQAEYGSIPSGPAGFFNSEGMMEKTQMISLREQPKTLRDYKNFHGDKEQIRLTEAIGWAAMAICFFGLMFGFLGS